VNNGVHVVGECQCEDLVGYVVCQLLALVANLVVHPLVFALNMAEFVGVSATVTAQRGEAVVQCIWQQLRTLTDAVTSLERLIEETHAIRTIINDSPDTDTITDCVPIIENAVHTLAQTYPEATIDTALPDTLPVHANASLQYAIESLIDNAIIHNPAQAPYVRVRAAESTTHRWVSISIDDNGPLIPDTETDIITGQTSISPTCHSSGLGLWLVKWTTELFGGELRFETSEFDGNTVQFRLPTTPS